jgi:hypothetical protein
MKKEKKNLDKPLDTAPVHRISQVAQIKRYKLTTNFGAPGLVTFDVFPIDRDKRQEVRT